MADDARVFFSTQTRLCYHIQRYIYTYYYLFVAVQFNATKNFPYSNPYELARLYCSIAMGEASIADLADWEREVAFYLLTIGAIEVAQYEQVLDRLARARVEDAALVLFLVPANEHFTLLDGDAHPGYDEEEEFRITDLRDEHKFEVRFINCRELEALREELE